MNKKRFREVCLLKDYLKSFYVYFIIFQLMLFRIFYMKKRVFLYLINKISFKFIILYF